MTDRQYFDATMRGHFLYWDMLGNLRGIENHTENNLRWLTGDIQHNYFADAAEPDAVELDVVAKRMRDGEIPKNLLLFFSETDIDTTEKYISSGLFVRDADTIAMAHELCDTGLPKPDRRMSFFRVREISQLKAAGAVLNSAFEYRLFPLERYVEMFENSGQYFYLAEYDGLPVGAVMSQHGDDFVNISWVGTLPGYRKLGIAGYLIQMAERDGLSNGKTIGVLNGYADIVGAYSRVGYKAYGRGIWITFCG